MRCCHLTASTFFGGPERQMLGLTQALQPEVETQFLLFREHGRAEAFASILQSNEISCRILSEDTPRLFACLREIERELQRHGSQVLFCHGYKANLLGCAAARRCGIPAVAVSRGWTWESRKVRFYNWLDRWHLRRMDHVVAVSAGQAAKVLACQVSATKLSIITNSARLSAFEHPAQSYSKSKLQSYFPVPKAIDRVVLSAGRFSPEKGFEVLIQAAQQVCERDRRVGFVLFGEGEQRVALEHQVRQLGLEQNFVMPGFTTELDRYFRAADVVALTSYTEGLPNVLLEASAAGVPIVATQVGGVPELIVEGNTGFLVPAGQPQAVAQRLLQLLWDESLRQRQGQAAQQRMRDLFTFEAQARAYKELLEELVPQDDLLPV